MALRRQVGVLSTPEMNNNHFNIILDVAVSHHGPGGNYFTKKYRANEH